jgi:hypothetical protein
MKVLNKIEQAQVNGGCEVDSNGNGGFGGHLTDRKINSLSY